MLPYAPLFGRKMKNIMPVFASLQNMAVLVCLAGEDQDDGGGGGDDEHEDEHEDGYEDEHEDESEDESEEGDGEDNDKDEEDEEDEQDEEVRCCCLSRLSSPYLNGRWAGMGCQVSASAA